MRSINLKNDKFKFKEPFDGLFTQGMVCHETYKDDQNNWLGPEEVELINKEFVKKSDHQKSNCWTFRIYVEIKEERYRS